MGQSGLAQQGGSISERVRGVTGERIRVFSESARAVPADFGVNPLVFGPIDSDQGGVDAIGFAATGAS